MTGRARIALLALAAACGGSDAFKLTASDNNPERLEAAFARMGAPRTGPVNASGPPTAYLVMRGPRGGGPPPPARERAGSTVPPPRSGVEIGRGPYGGGGLIAFDLAGKKELWRVAAEVSSKVVVGADFVAHTERDTELVARDPATGAVLWQRALGGRFIGAAADGGRLFYTAGGGSRWVLTALDGR